MLLTVPFVIFGILRYQLLSDPSAAGSNKVYNPEKDTEKPEEILLSDKVIQYTIFAWIFITVIVGLLAWKNVNELIWILFLRSQTKNSMF